MRSSTLHCLLALLLAGAAAFVLHGCNGEVRLSKGQAQALANARTGAVTAQQQRDAVAHAEDPAQANLAAQALLDSLMSGTLSYVMAATANVTDLPAPTFKPADLVIPERAAAFADAGKVAAADPPKGPNYVLLAKLGTAGVGLLGLIFTLGKNVPGLGGVAFGAASALWSALAPQTVKDQEAAIDDGLDVALAYGERLASVLTNAGFGHLVEDAKLRAAFLAQKLGATEEIDRRLALIRAGGVALPPLPADKRSIPVVMAPTAPAPGAPAGLPPAST